MLKGKRISGRYKVLEVIGGGGMSNVYLAHDMILNRDVAVKVLHYSFNDEEEAKRRFQREALSATSLNHPNIVSIYDVGEDEGMHYLVMEYVKGMTLKQYINEYAPLAPTRCVEIMEQLTSAIMIAHQHQIIHRDIKPQNILLDEDGHVKITDFGIAMALSSTSFTKTNSVLGTVHYLSPEQARGGIATKKSDIYSLGIVLYELLTGELPFSGESAVSIALKHLQSETPSVRAIVPTIPQSLENVVLISTSKDARHRYPTVEKMRDDLETVLSLERAHEAKFVVPEDHDATKAMPIIKARPIYDQQSEEVSAIVQPPKTSEKPRKKKSKLKWLVALIGALLIIFAVLYFTMPQFFSAKKIAVPDVTDSSLDHAIDKLQGAGFAIGKQTTQNSSAINEGKVINTRPAAGTERQKGTEVDLVISEGKAKKTMSDYIGKNIDQVKSILEKQGYKNIVVKKSFSSKEIDSVIKQSPMEGSSNVPSETTITLTISKGVAENILSNLIGFDENALKTYANSSGFNIKITDEAFSDDVAKGQVMAQSIEAGTSLKVGSTINVTLSKGMEKKPAKRFVKTVEIQFEPEEDDDGEEANYQKIKIYIQDATHSIKDVHQEFRIYDDIKKNITLEIEQGKEASYRVERDGEVLYDETISYDDL
ncbi:serine/threonine protein kinase [Kurthia sibirica]|uniref:Serine/threonine-protein kinase PrkC n=1 Tax=Kurthia sibirica TaxID=202750 RepID=A0A2U3AQN6_9BACL|nr:Stk1 family PASTA domain-containing Ser/Thr kinase [Kurthia sibirica]PWI26853.1 Stk1 family PASTA domain-containing Ser/Thr kinase [Kurthia sibirica]GEK32609.1 serine/threonine protein kinase [Kurthia sibirica]